MKEKYFKYYSKRSFEIKNTKTTSMHKKTFLSIDSRMFFLENDSSGFSRMGRISTFSMISASKTLLFKELILTWKPLLINKFTVTDFINPS